MEFLKELILAADKIQDRCDYLQEGVGLLKGELGSRHITVRKRETYEELIDLLESSLIRAKKKLKSISGKIQKVKRRWRRPIYEKRR